MWGYPSPRINLCLNLSPRMKAKKGSGARFIGPVLPSLASSRHPTSSISWHIFPMCLIFFPRRSEGFPFIVGGLGVGPVFGSRAPCRRNVRVNCRENCRVNCRVNCRENSVPIGEKLQTASSSEVSGCPLATPCLWGKLQNASFLKVSNCQNWRLSRRNPLRYCEVAESPLFT